jgi:hypothetical protein
MTGDPLHIGSVWPRRVTAAAILACPDVSKAARARLIAAGGG